MNLPQAGIKKILLAEDIELNQYLARHILESNGMEVSIANNGHEALLLMETNSFDCILMDVQMPEMDGIEATLRIRRFSDKVKASIPIIALTANVHHEDIKKYKEAGMNDFLAKPFDETGLLLAISKNRFPDSEGGREIGRTDKTNEIPEGIAKIYDLGMVEAIAGGDQAFIKKMVALFIETVPANVQDLQQAVATENWDQASKMAHKLKSTVDSMGLKLIKQDIRTVEANAKQRVSLTEIPALADKIERVISVCIEQLRQELK
jgi:CheY-like chemotaxis protein